MRTWIILPVLILVLVLACVVYGFETTIFWNATGTYIQVRDLGSVPDVSTFVNAYYNLTSYHRITRDYVTINSTQCILVNGTGIYVLNGTTTSCLVVEPGICAVLNNSTWYCRSSLETTPLNVTISPGTYNVSAQYGMCIFISWGNITAESYTLHLDLYNYYSQELIWSITSTGPGHVLICGVPDRVLLNVSKNGKWLGLFLIQTATPTVVLPRSYIWLAAVIPVALFGLLAIREGSRDAAVGMIAAGAVLEMAGTALGLVANPYLHASAILLMLIGGILYIISQTKS